MKSHFFCYAKDFIDFFPLNILKQENKEVCTLFRCCKYYLFTVHLESVLQFIFPVCNRF